MSRAPRGEDIVIKPRELPVPAPRLVTLFDLLEDARRAKEQKK